MFIGGLLLIAGLAFQENPSANSTTKSNDAVPFREFIPTEFHGHYAYDWSECDTSTNRAVNGLYIGKTLFGPVANREPRAPILVQKVNRAEGGGVMFALFGLEGQGEMSLSEDDGLEIAWVDGNFFRLKKCSNADRGEN